MQCAFTGWIFQNKKLPTGVLHDEPVALSGREASGITLGIRRGSNRRSIGVARLGLPRETKLFQLGNALLGNVTGLAFMESLELPALVVDPSAKLGVRSPLRGHHTVPVAFPVVGELAQAFQPRGFVRVPAESNVVQGLGAFLRHVRRLSLLHESVMASLLLDPQAELGVGCMRKRDMTMSIFFLEGGQIVHVALPGRFLGIPGEVQFEKFLHTFFRDTRWFAILQELVLFAARVQQWRNIGRETRSWARHKRE